MKIGEIIRNYRTANNLSQREFAKKCDISFGYISMLESGKNPRSDKPLVPALTVLNKLAIGMGITIDQLIEQADDMDISLAPTRVQVEFNRKNMSGLFVGTYDENEFVNKVMGSLRPITKKRFPMLGEIACGKPLYANEDHESYVDASADIDADFCLTAKGDSMIGARIHAGDVVFIKSMPIVDNGAIAAVIIDDEATLKRWYYYPEQQKLMLTAENPAYAPLMYVGEELNSITCLGKAVCFMSNL